MNQAPKRWPKIIFAIYIGLSGKETGKKPECDNLKVSLKKINIASGIKYMIEYINLN